MILNPKVNKKNQKDDQMDENEDLLTLKVNTLKRKSSHSSGKDEENDNDIYESENIPRSKKMHKMEIKKKEKKERKNGKLTESLNKYLQHIFLNYFHF